MKFVVDAQLPRRLARELVQSGHDAANRTPDKEIAARAIRENRIVMTKDNDFVTSFLLHGVPPKLLLITTGNISNDHLSKLLASNLTALENAFSNYDFVELSALTITIHA